MILIQNLSKQYNTQCVLNNIHIKFEKGSITGLVGFSGSGKSTFLRCIHGVEKIDHGNISITGKTGLIFQHFNLFPHMSVMENIIYAPIKVLKKSRTEVAEEAKKLLHRVHLWDKRNAYPHQLSGGQEQRVAILRALIMSPEALLLDEPTSALDPSLTQEMINVIQDLKNQELTIIIASHDLAFLKKVANRIVFLDKGKLIFDQETNRFFNDTMDQRKHKFLNAFQQQYQAGSMMDC